MTDVTPAFEVWSGSRKSIARVAWALNWLSMGSILAIMGLVVADVIGRKVFNSPIKGTLEVSQLLLVAVIFLGLAHTSLVKGHIRIDLVVSRLSSRAQAILGAVANAVAIAISALMVWQGTSNALFARLSGETTDVLHIPTFPARLLVPLGILVACFALTSLLTDSARQIVRPGSKK